jgi:hypothetical protein
MQSIWLLAQPTPGQARAGDALADPGFHHAMAGRVSFARQPGSPDVGILLGERLARSRGPGGHTVAGAWSDSGAEVTVIADADPRHQSATRQLLVDGAGAVEQWARDVRRGGAGGACWHADLLPSAASVDQARLTAEILGAMVRAELAPTLWFTRPGLASIRELLEGAAAHGADLSRLTVVVPVAPPPAGLGEVVDALRGLVPADIRRVLVVVPRVRLHLAQSDAFELAEATARRPLPWPVDHCAGDLALRQVGAWWREPGLARRAGNRFETILGQLARPTGPVYAREQDPDGPERPDQPDAGARRVFDTSLFRRRSLYRSPTPSQT